MPRKDREAYNQYMKDFRERKKSKIEQEALAYAQVIASQTIREAARKRDNEEAILKAYENNIKPLMNLLSWEQKDKVCLLMEKEIAEKGDSEIRLSRGVLWVLDKMKEALNTVKEDQKSIK